jgi:hypothetical protein
MVIASLPRDLGTKKPRMMRGFIEIGEPKLAKAAMASLTLSQSYVQERP